MGKKPWSPYAVKKSEKADISSKKCRQMNTIQHTTHIDSAIEILKHGRITKSRIYNHSILEERKVQVAWITANYWRNGSRYGNVAFQFNTSKFMDGKNFFWAGVNSDPKNAICQILVSSRDYSSYMTPYDPVVDNGPWWHDEDSNKHYFNENVVLEFMMDRDLWLKDASGINFINHHEKMCSLYEENPSNCKHINTYADEACTEFLRKVGSAGLSLGKRKHLWPIEDSVASVFSHGLARFLNSPIRKVSYKGKEPLGKKLAGSLARAVLHAIVIDKEDEAKRIIRLFRSEEELAEAFARIMDDCLGMNDVDFIKRKILLI
jgi:hypothetical protein